MAQPPPGVPMVRISRRSFDKEDVGRAGEQAQGSGRAAGFSAGLSGRTLLTSRIVGRWSRVSGNMPVNCLSLSPYAAKIIAASLTQGEGEVSRANAASSGCRRLARAFQMCSARAARL